MVPKNVCKGFGAGVVLQCTSNIMVTENELGYQDIYITFDVILYETWAFLISGPTASDVHANVYVLNVKFWRKILALCDGNGRSDGTGRSEAHLYARAETASIRRGCQ